MDDLDGYSEARALLDRAHETLRQLRSRVPGLASDMRWRSRAAVEFGEALAQWTALLQRIDDEIEAWDAVLARRQARALAAEGAG